jgi:hypothetical protein
MKKKNQEEKSIAITKEEKKKQEEGKNKRENFRNLREGWANERTKKPHLNIWFDLGSSKTIKTNSSTTSALMVAGSQ